jgi:predicted small integral membrane protein
MKEIQTRKNQTGEVSTGSLRFLAGIVAFIAVLAVIAYFWGQSASAPNLAWMGWTKPTAIFFITIVCLLLGMCVWEAFSPGGGPRIGILRFETTRGDRLFLSLLGSGFIHLAWLGLVGPDLWKALGVSIAYAILVFAVV